MGHRSVFPAFVLAVALGFSHVGTAQAAKLVHVHIEQAGKVILGEARLTGGDYADAAEFWAKLGRAKLKALVEIPVDPSDPNQATLTGDMRIVMSGGRPLASAQVDKLRLIRVPGTGDMWQIPSDEVERTAHVAGLQLHGPVRYDWPWITGIIVVCVLVAIVVCVLAGGLVWLAVRFLWRKPSESPEGDVTGR